MSLSIDPSKAKKITVDVELDFVEKQTTRADPIQAVSELIWNSLDAEASEVHVEFEFNDLAGGLSKIYIIDNGTGFSHEEATSLFGKIGGSWKRQKRQTPKLRRMIHGQEGKGRYKAFSLGKSVEWKVRHLNENDRIEVFSLGVLSNSLKSVFVTEPTYPENVVETGVVVEITDIEKQFKKLISDEGIQEFSEIFAPYLINYKDVQIVINGERINPSEAVGGVPFIVETRGGLMSLMFDLWVWCKFLSGTRAAKALLSRMGLKLVGD
ncbi:MAG: ATP-binding protein, partial [Puniceicoccaceae bacterium]